MAALAMSGAPPPLPSRAGRPDPPSVNTLPRRGPTSTPTGTSRPQSSQTHRNRRQSEGEIPPPPPRSRHDPLPPVPPSTGSLPTPQVNQQRHSSHTLPRNSRSESNLQSYDPAPPRLPPRRSGSLHGAQTSRATPHLMNGSHPPPIQESDDLESRFMFHDVNELPPPPEFKNVKKKYSSQEYERHKRQKRTPEPSHD